MARLTRNPAGGWMFTYRGDRYIIMRGSDRPERDGSLYVCRLLSDAPGDWEITADGFGYLSEIRDRIDKAHREGWDKVY